MQPITVKDVQNVTQISFIIELPQHQSNADTLHVIDGFKTSFHDTVIDIDIDTDILAMILAMKLTKMSVSVSWNAAFMPDKVISNDKSIMTVSYTHLTLPTILRV